MEDQPQVPKTGTVETQPTKSFFVAMLTRDIELVDAIMDLVDNCVDGVHRSIEHDPIKKGSIKPYEGFCAEIFINANEFKIKDNCGGISLEIAKERAFRFGRDLTKGVIEDPDLETVGMYGIGMKRAIFKMGTEADITSWHADDIFTVTIPKNWITEKEWEFTYTLREPDEIRQVLQEQGMLLSIRGLSQSISRQFSDRGGFLSDLSSRLQQHYGFILSKGFRIVLNGSEIPKLEISLLSSEFNEDKSIKPFIYVGNVDDVNVSVAIGFYTTPPSSKEIKEELNGTRANSKSGKAGITIMCNERVVLYNDKTYLTGWGDTGIPEYHTQFIAITGVVHFKSKNPYLLPVTTTKRGLDTSSLIYLQIKVKIKQGLKLFTSFTNQWKTKSEERDRIFQNTTRVMVLQPIQEIRDEFSLVSNLKKDGDYQIPNLPKPTRNSEEKNVTIKFRKEAEKVKRIADYFLNDSNKSPEEVGSFCFDEQYSKLENY